MIPISAHPLSIDPKPPLFYLNVFTNNTLTSIITFTSFHEAINFQTKLNKHSLTKRATNPEPL